MATQTATKTFPAQLMDKLASEFDGAVGFYVKDLATGARHEHNPDQRIPTASICKVPVMIELFRRCRGEASGGSGLGEAERAPDASPLHLDDRHMLSGSISTLGTGVLSMTLDPPVMTLRDYCRLMITVSDNVATDYLIGLLGTDNINRTMDALGFHNTRTTMTIGKWHYMMRDLFDAPSMEGDRKMRELAAAGGQLNPNSLSYSTSLENNVTTARDMGNIMERIYHGQIVSPEASHEMLEVLKACESRGKIPRDLNPDVTVAHKVGGSNRIQGDVGMVLLPTGPLIVCVLTLAREQDRGAAAVKLIGDLSRLAVEAFSPESVLSSM